MPLYMDIHRNIEALTADAAEGAHKRDLEVQDKHGAEFLRYWYNEADGTVFCLVQAPSREAAASVHREAHGLMPDDIVEVTEGV